jgi:hypothetical protein
MKIAIGLLGVLMLTGCAMPVIATPAPVTEIVEVPIYTETIRTVYIEVPVVQETTKYIYEPYYKAPRQFKDGDEIKEYLGSVPVYMPQDDEDCDDVARMFMLNALEDGYWVSLQWLPSWHGESHLLIMALCDNNSAYYIEPRDNTYWWVSPID